MYNRYLVMMPWVLPGNDHAIRMLLGPPTTALMVAGACGTVEYIIIVFIHPGIKKRVAFNFNTQNKPGKRNVKKYFLFLYFIF